jgi:hypothetical protein
MSRIRFGGFARRGAAHVSTIPSDDVLGVRRPCGSAKYSLDPISIRREVVRLNSLALYPSVPW